MSLSALLNQYGDVVLFNQTIFIPSERSSVVLETHYKDISLVSQRKIEDVVGTLSLAAFCEEFITPALRKQPGDTFCKGNVQQIFNAFPATATNPLYVSGVVANFLGRDKRARPLLRTQQGKYGSIAEYPFSKIQEIYRKHTGVEITPIKDTFVRQEVKGNSVEIIKKIPPFLITVNRTKYFFEGPEIVVTLTQDPRGAKLDKPRVYTRNYNHPFVYDDGRICYNDLLNNKRWENDRIHFSYVTDYQTQEFIEMVRRAFDHAQTNLVKGYFGDVAPVKRLSTGYFKYEAIRGKQFD